MFQTNSVLTKKNRTLLNSSYKSNIYRANKIDNISTHDVTYRIHKNCFNADIRTLDNEVIDNKSLRSSISNLRVCINSNRDMRIYKLTEIETFLVRRHTPYRLLKQSPWDRFYWRYQSLYTFISFNRQMKMHQKNPTSIRYFYTWCNL